MGDRYPDEPQSVEAPRSDIVGQAGDDPSTFSSLLGHYYRGEIDRMTTWRTRLDQTTNWAVVVMAAILTWAFSTPGHPHYVLLIGAFATWAFPFIEAQRYQEYDAWRSRVRILQQNLFADTLQRAGPVHRDWRDRLGQELREPTVRLPLWKALGHRLQRVYFPLFTVLLAAWGLRITVFEPRTPWYQTAAIASLPGTVVVAVVVAGYLLLFALTAWSLHESTKREFDDDSMDEKQ